MMLIATGARPATAHQMHRTIRTALGEAVRRRQIQENVATLARAPKIDAKELEPYAVAEVRRILNAARERSNAARWVIALSLGLRQSEVLGLHWSALGGDGPSPHRPVRPRGQAVLRLSRLEVAVEAGLRMRNTPP